MKRIFIEIFGWVKLIFWLAVFIIYFCLMSLPYISYAFMPRGWRK